MALPERRRRAEQTRAAILAAAGRRVAKVGFREMRLEDVGGDVGIGRSAVLYHFKGKRELYRAMLDDLFGGLLGMLRATLSAPGGIAERIEAGVARFVEYVGRRPVVARVAMREAMNPDRSVRAELQARARPFLDLLERILEEGERSGTFQPGRTDTFHFVSILAGATLFYIAALPSFVSDLPYDPLSDEQLAAHQRDVLDIARRLLGIREPQAPRTGP